jgi:inward rectifier potassium channel
LKFSLFVLLFYLAMNTLFAFVYLPDRVDHLTNTSDETEWLKFMDAFLFSSQSITTVGYGRVAPLGIAAGSVAGFGIALWVACFALVTGLLYARFSRANAKIIPEQKYSPGPPIAMTPRLCFALPNMREHTTGGCRNPR